MRFNWLIDDIIDNIKMINKKVNNLVEDFNRIDKINRKVGLFEKVSFEQFKEVYLNIFCSDIDYTELNNMEENMLLQAYEKITLPTRSTSGSAGYDFVTPVPIYLNFGESITIPTGIRCKINDGWFLAMFPRSGLGFKFRLQLDNTVGIIDSDYYNSENKGHILIKITNDSKPTLGNKKLITVDPGKAFAQGIFLPYGITYNDVADGVRNGGFGSTDK